jgi:DNA-binding NarL/FixJ family response regulator
MTTKDERRATMRAEVRARRAGQSAPAVPAGTWIARGACNSKVAVFEDEARRREALAICATCPVLRECSVWALHNAVDGVAGGLTPDERTLWRTANGMAEPVVHADDFLPPEVVMVDAGKFLIRSDAILTAVARWTEDGESARQIGDRLGVASRTVVRYRNVCRDRALIAS